MSPPKDTPYSAEYGRVLEQIKRDADDIDMVFQQGGTDRQAVAELRNLRLEATKPIPDDASFEQKYQIAFGNMIRARKGGVDLVRKHLGKDGIEKYIRVAVEAEKKSNASPALLILGVIRAVSPGRAFVIFARQMSSQLKWVGHWESAELTPHRAVYKTSHCLMTDYPGTEDVFCQIGCMGIGTKWVAEQFKVDVRFNRQGGSCAFTLTPLR